MNIDYKTTSVHPDVLRTMHIIVIDGELLTSTREKEIKAFAKNRGISKYDWRKLKDAIRLGETLKISDGE